MSAIEGVVAYQGWSLRGVPLYSKRYSKNIRDRSKKSRTREYNHLIIKINMIKQMHNKYDKLYDSDSGSGLQLRTQSSPGKRNGQFSQNGKFGQNGKFSQNGKFGQNGMSGQKGKVHLGPNVSSSAHYRGCVVNGSGAMAAI